MIFYIVYRYSCQHNLFRSLFYFFKKKFIFYEMFRYHQNNHLRYI